MNTSTRRTARLPIVMALLGLATIAQADPVERTVPADARGEVEIVNVAGDVQVRGWDRAEVQVHADLGDGVEKLDVQSSRGRTSINVIARNGRNSSSGSDLIVEVPRDSTLIVKTVSADQTIAAVRGAQRLQAVSGSINTQVWGQEVAIKTISGEVTVAGQKVAGRTAVNTVSGDVNLSDIAGELTLETVTGDMGVRMPTLSRARIQTTNGELRLRAALTADATLDAEAINGDLSFLLQAPVNAEFDVETFNGEIDNCFGPKPVRTREFAPGNALRFKEGNGGARVRVKTLNGGVEICR
ncbi:DUF4097 family beta strand repeat-containing protein [Povalibacter sp.]|uniref:DUF4097 family beta strand repeat-containing protein n=1 Tax=Povalibacter sp. TaxID=1962978 RepID=UPI002F3EFF98